MKHAAYAVVFLLCAIAGDHAWARDSGPPEKRPDTNAESKLLEPGNWPVTVEAAVADIITSLSPENKEVIRGTKREDLIMFHFSWGMWIRNYYGLWRGNAELIKSACGGNCHPDDASMVIIEKAWETLQTGKE
ncbi:MAG: hypothetical protein LBU06_10935 [Desulfovibrio sp.]|jgi:hypothetical protein|nr:hypothetical protein [Desulfovibrio sp.]